MSTTAEALDELRRVPGRLLARARDQLDFAAAVVEGLRCGAAGAEPLPLDSSPPPAARDERPAPPAAAAAAPATAAPAAETLAIPDYDALAASQVLPRLTGLGTEELEAIRDYESAHRGRRTILARLAQLLD